MCVLSLFLEVEIFDVARHTTSRHTHTHTRTTACHSLRSLLAILLMASSPSCSPSSRRLHALIEAIDAENRGDNNATRMAFDGSAAPVPAPPHERTRKRTLPWHTLRGSTARGGDSRQQQEMGYLSVDAPIVYSRSCGECNELSQHIVQQLRPALIGLDIEWRVTYPAELHPACTRPYSKFAPSEPFTSST